MSFEHDVTLSSIELYPLNAHGVLVPIWRWGRCLYGQPLLVKLVADDGCFGWGEIWAKLSAAPIFTKPILLRMLLPAIAGVTFAAPVELTEFLRHRLSTCFLHHRSGTGVRTYSGRA